MLSKRVVEDVKKVATGAPEKVKKSTEGKEKHVSNLLHQ
jgi:hypothetical protein